MYENASQEEVIPKLSGASDIGGDGANDVGNNSVPAGTITCKFIPSSLQPQTRRGKAKGKTSQEGKSCHVCIWERQYHKAKHVLFCQSHHVRACMEIPSID